MNLHLFYGQIEKDNETNESLTSVNIWIEIQYYSNYFILLYAYCISAA